MQGLTVAWSQILFWVLAVAVVGCSVAVVATQNIVRCAMWLLFALGATAGLFFLLGAGFVGAAQLLIYVGGTLVLVVFGVMLTAQGPFVRMRTGGGDWVLASLAGMALLILLLLTISVTGWPRWGVAAGEVDTAVHAARSPTTTRLGLALLGIAAQGQELPRDPAGVGYLLPFEIVSVHLLVVLIGAAYLARTRRPRRGTAR